MVFKGLIGVSLDLLYVHVILAELNGTKRQPKRQPLEELTTPALPSQMFVGQRQ